MKENGSSLDHHCHHYPSSPHRHHLPHIVILLIIIVTIDLVVLGMQLQQQLPVSDSLSPISIPITVIITTVIFIMVASVKLEPNRSKKGVLHMGNL